MPSSPPLTAPGYTAEQARSALDRVTLAYPQLEVRDQAEFQETQESQIDSFLGVVNAFLAISLVVALMGVANTLALSVFERTRELGLLRAVGMSRRQARRMIRWEGGIVSVFGGLMGITIGVLFGWAAVEITSRCLRLVVLHPVGHLVDLPGGSGGCRSAGRLDSCPPSQPPQHLGSHRLRIVGQRQLAPPVTLRTCKTPPSGRR